MDGTSCPTPDGLAGYAAHGLATDEHGEITAHLAACDSCRRTVSLLAVLASRPASDGAHAKAEAGTTVGRFELVRKLGHGSMGEVWAARDSELEREVALKLIRLRPGAIGAEERLRLRREAQAMARLNHPNVVKIYELGTADDERLFCAMELVAGVTLREYLATPRPWRDIVAIAAAIGHGLAEAHAAGLVHRDVKPENILIATDGSALLSDFGLARIADVEDGRAAGVAPATLELTTAGSMIGTPLYMAPEQLAGGAADPRSDQFAYCVTVYEALFGERPFAADTLDALARAIERGAPGPAHRRGVPVRVWRALQRGLAVDPAKRWPAMADLVAQLERARSASRRHRASAAGATVLAAAGAGAMAFALSAREPDAARDAPLVRAWNPIAAARLSAAFLAAGGPAASDHAAATASALDQYRADWSTQRRAVRPGGVLAAKQLGCFDRLAIPFVRLVALFMQPTRRDVEDAASMVFRLEAPESCHHLDRVAAHSPESSTWSDLTELELLQISGRNTEALAAATALVRTAEAAPNPMLLARARYNLAEAQTHTGDPQGAAETMRRAVQEAAAAQDHYLVARAWLRVFRITALDLDRAREADAMLPTVRAAIAQAGGDAAQLAELEEALGILAYAQGDLSRARAQLEAARAQRIAAHGPDHPLLAGVENSLAAVLIQLGAYDDAIAHLDHAAAICRARYGARHPFMATIEGNRATIAHKRRDWRASERHARTALAIQLEAYSPKSVDTAALYDFVARALREQRRFDEARAQLELARAAYERALPEDHISRIMLELDFAQIDADAGRSAAAAQAARQVVARLRAVKAPPRMLVVGLSVLAAWTARASPQAGLPIYEETLEQLILTPGRDPAATTAFLSEVARVASAAGRPRTALAWISRFPEVATRVADVKARLEAAAVSRPRPPHGR